MRSGEGGQSLDLETPRRSRFAHDDLGGDLARGDDLDISREAIYYCSLS